MDDDRWTVDSLVSVAKTYDSGARAIRDDNDRPVLPADYNMKRYYAFSARKLDRQKVMDDA